MPAWIEGRSGVGRAEVVMGVFENYDSNLPLGAGSAHVWLSGTVSGGGEFANLSADVSLRGAPGFTRFGEDLASGDVDGDGLGDLLVGSGYSYGGTHLFLGSELVAGGEMGVSAAAVSWLAEGGADLIPDFDGDGFDDVTVSGGGGLIPSQFARLLGAR